MKFYNKYRLITFLYLLILFTLVEISITFLNIDDIYLQIAVVLPFIMILQKPYDRVIRTMAQQKMKTFEKTCMIEDIEDYVEFTGKRYKRIFFKKRRFESLLFYYLTSFYAYNNEFEETKQLLEYINEDAKYNSNKIQILNIEILKEAIKGNFEKADDLYVEILYSIDIELSKNLANQNQTILLNQIKLVLGKFIELTKDVNEETIKYARLWINKKVNLYNAIDNYCIVKILEHHNNTEYIDEFKDNLKNINGDIPFLKID